MVLWKSVATTSSYGEATSSIGETTSWEEHVIESSASANLISVRDSRVPHLTSSWLWIATINVSVNWLKGLKFSLSYIWKYLEIVKGQLYIKTKERHCDKNIQVCWNIHDTWIKISIKSCFQAIYNITFLFAFIRYPDKIKNSKLPAN